MSAGYHMARADFLTHDGCLAEALVACDQAIALEPWNAYAHASKALILRRMGRFDAARMAMLAAQAATGFAQRKAYEHELVL